MATPRQLGYSILTPQPDQHIEPEKCIISPI